MANFFVQSNNNNYNMNLVKAKIVIISDDSRENKTKLKKTFRAIRFNLS